MKHLTLIHNNDMHGDFLPEEKDGKLMFRAADGWRNDVTLIGADELGKCRFLTVEKTS